MDDTVELAFQDIAEGIIVKVDGSQLVLECANGSIELRQKHGLYRTLIANMIEGVTNGFVKNLEIIGVGYKVAMKGKDLDLSMGFSHPVIFKAPEFSVSYTSKLFTKHIGLPFVKYLSYVRVRASLEALLEGKESIAPLQLLS